MRRNSQAARKGRMQGGVEGFLGRRRALEGAECI